MLLSYYANTNPGKVESVVPLNISLPYPVKIDADLGNDLDVAVPNKWYISGSTVRSITEDDIIDELRSETRQAIKNYIQTAMARGCNTGIRGIVVDCTHNDLINLQSLYDISTSDVVLRDKNNQFNTVTHQELGDIVNAIKLYGLSSYSQKWSLESEINTATAARLREIINLCLIV